jgi:hypothetical protein
MKVTKTRLKQIIKEELEATLLEGDITDPKEQEERAKKFKSQIGRTINTYTNEFRSPNQEADLIIHILKMKGVKSKWFPKSNEPTEYNKFNGTENAATSLYNFMDQENPKLVLAALFKAYSHVKTKKQDVKQYAKDRNAKESQGVRKFIRAGGNLKDLPKKRPFLTHSVELVNEEQ